MNTKLISKTLLAAGLAASSVLLTGTPTQAAPARQDIEEFNQANALKEAGWTAPAIEEYTKVRREAIARAEAEKAAKHEAALATGKAAATN